MQATQVDDGGQPLLHEGQFAVNDGDMRQPARASASEVDVPGHTLFPLQFPARFSARNPAHLTQVPEPPRELLPLELLPELPPELPPLEPPLPELPLLEPPEELH